MELYETIKIALQAAKESGRHYVTRNEMWGWECDVAFLPTTITAYRVEPDGAIYREKWQLRHASSEKIDLDAIEEDEESEQDRTYAEAAAIIDAEMNEHFSADDSDDGTDNPKGEV